MNIDTLLSLPPPDDPSFRTVLKEVRQARQMTQYKLAKIAGIAQVMPARYEDADNPYATLPTQATWAKLNAALFPAAKESAEALAPLLTQASIAQIVEELKQRGAISVAITW